MTVRNKAKQMGLLDTTIKKYRKHKNRDSPNIRRTDQKPSAIIKIRVKAGKCEKNTFSSGELNVDVFLNKWMNEFLEKTENTPKTWNGI